MNLKILYLLWWKITKMDMPYTSEMAGRLKTTYGVWFIVTVVQFVTIGQINLKFL